MNPISFTFTCALESAAPIPLRPATCPTADFSGDCFVNLADVAVLSDEWLVLYDMDDLLTLAQQWLDGG